MRYGNFEYNQVGSGIEITKYKGCDSSVEIPQYIDGLPVISMGESAFLGCKSLKSIRIPNSVKKIGIYAFSRCTSLTSIIISNSVTKIDKYTFSFCNQLTNITIPDSVKEIDTDAFFRCSSLLKIEIPHINENLPSLRSFLNEYKKLVVYYVDPFKRIKNLTTLLNSLSAISRVNWK